MWLYLWSHARFDLHLTDAEFWSLTPRQYSYLDRRFRQERDWQHSLVAKLCAVSANYSMCHPETPYTVADFLPRKNQKPVEQSIDEQNDALVQFLIRSGAATVVQLKR